MTRTLCLLCGVTWTGKRHECHGVKPTLAVCPACSHPLTAFCPSCRGRSGGLVKSSAKTAAVRLNATLPRGRKAKASARPALAAGKLPTQNGG